MATLCETSVRPSDERIVVRIGTSQPAEACEAMMSDFVFRFRLNPTETLDTFLTNLLESEGLNQEFVDRVTISIPTQSAQTSISKKLFPEVLMSKLLRREMKNTAPNNNDAGIDYRILHIIFRPGSFQLINQQIDVSGNLRPAGERYAYPFSLPTVDANILKSINDSVNPQMGGVLAACVVTTTTVADNNKSVITLSDLCVVSENNPLSIGDDRESFDREMFSVHQLIQLDLGAWVNLSALFKTNQQQSEQQHLDDLLADDDDDDDDDDGLGLKVRPAPYSGHLDSGDPPADGTIIISSSSEQTHQEQKQTYGIIHEKYEWDWRFGKKAKAGTRYMFGQVVDPGNNDLYVIFLGSYPTPPTAKQMTKDRNAMNIYRNLHESYLAKLLISKFWTYHFCGVDEEDGDETIIRTFQATEDSDMLKDPVGLNISIAHCENLEALAQTDPEFASRIEHAIWKASAPTKEEMNQLRSARLAVRRNLRGGGRKIRR